MLFFKSDILSAWLTKGHTLVVPKQHYDNFLSCEEETLAHLMKVASMLGRHIMQKTNAAGMNILSNVNEAAGQSVMHFHVHLIPRYDTSDAITLEFNPSPKQDMDALKELLTYSK